MKISPMLRRDMEEAEQRLAFLTKQKEPDEHKINKVLKDLELIYKVISKLSQDDGSKEASEGIQDNPNQ